MKLPFKTSFAILSLWVAVALCPRVEAQTYDTNNPVVQTFAGSGFSGYLDGQGQQTMFNGPQAVVADTFGNLFVADSSNNRIRKISPDGNVTTFAGGGSSLPGYGTNAYLGSVIDGPLSIDHSNALWLGADNAAVRIDTNGYASSISLGSISVVGGICFDSTNNLYASSTYNNKIYRRLTNGTLELFVGSGNSGSTDGNGVFTSFTYPRALVADTANNIYVYGDDHLIRRINQNRDVVTIAGRVNTSSQVDGRGTNAGFNFIDAMWPDDLGNIYLACATSIRKMTADTNVTTISGSFSQSGYTNGPGNQARFNGAAGVCIAQGTIYVAESGNERIRSITFNPPEQQVTGADLDLSTYPGLRIAGIVGRTYRIEASADLTAWHALTTLLLTRSPYLWIDENAVAGNKFYRAFLLP